METSIIISGFGGQGALFAGQLLAHAALESDREVTWIPSYGPEMRGGTAHCTVIVADEPIGSPLVRNPHCVIALNLPSVDKYETQVPQHLIDGLTDAAETAAHLDATMEQLHLKVRRYRPPAPTIAI